MRNFLLLACLFLYCSSIGQSSIQQLALLEKDLATIEASKISLLKQIENKKLEILQVQRLKNGLPAIGKNEKVIHHAAFSCVYSQVHKQAKWVAHIISPEISTGNVSRSNDFRSDSLIQGGTAIEEDYFLTIEDEAGQTVYDGFGYDRGHLAPSADFRWSQKALSESYLYSNIAPQLPDFNRKIWADLENLLRNYVYSKQTPLYIVTGGVLNNNLTKIERGIHQVSIPKAFWKVALDLKNKEAIAFLIPNALANYPIEHYALNIDELEKIIDINFFANLNPILEKQVENQYNIKKWLPLSAKGDVAPLPFEFLPKKHYNTILAKKQVGTGTEIHVCGTVVKARKSRKGHIILNLDKAWPNELFNIFIRKEKQIHFRVNLLKDYNNQQICIFGEVKKLGKTPTIFLEREEGGVKLF